MIVKQPPVIFKATGRFQPFGCYKSHVVDRALSVLSDAAASTSKPVEVPRGPAQERTAGRSEFMAVGSGRLVAQALGCMALRA